ncbi:hypothetical protein [Salinibacterium sp. M195]|uniref:hypothetical protein n=1 Tax=Salinibacterium sp. M195 TaxID=2583374 RepID=UPI002107602E|nr:hypothetical protein [Salinibacterium sp. M195]QYH36827.1 hypothetical protein FFT87_13265 [Salinibacterium sp. M195]
MISFTSLAYSAILWTATPSPEPSVYPEYNGDVNLVTPGVIGFLGTLFIAVATLLIVVDMNRRVRRVRYRALAQEAILSEQAAADAADAADASGAVDVADESSATSDADDQLPANNATDGDDSTTQRAD